MDLFHSIDNLKSQLASVAFLKEYSSSQCPEWNRAVIELPVVVSMPKLLVHGMGFLSPKLHQWQNLNINFEMCTSIHEMPLMRPCGILNQNQKVLNAILI